MTVIRYKTGTQAGSLAALLREWPGAVPEWSWYEPRPGSLLGTQLAASDLHPTLRPGPVPEVPPDPFAVDEARLFWGGGSVHLLDDGDRVRWFQWSQTGDPHWMDSDRGATSCKVRPRTPYGVLLRESYAAFGLGDTLPAHHAAVKLEVAEYWAGQRLFAWTLRQREDSANGGGS